MVDAQYECVTMTVRLNAVLKDLFVEMYIDIDI